MIDQEIEKNELNLLSDELDSLQDAKQVLIEEIESTKNDINYLSQYKYLVADYQKNKKLYVGKEYIDLGARNNDKDQFLRWFNLDGSGMGNSSGMRGFKYINKPGKTSLKAFVILITSNVGDPRGNNKWKDAINTKNKEIMYFGDAKMDQKKKAEDFLGNKIVLNISDHILEGKCEFIPPILHFTKERVGYMKFNGLCIMNDLRRSFHIENDIKVRNYLLDLKILDVDHISLDWLHLRRIDYNSSIKIQPDQWSEYINRIM